MTPASNRRGFVRLLVDQTLRGVREVAPSVSGPAALAARHLSEPAAPVENVERTTAAAPVTRGVDRRELDVLAQEAGLVARREAVQALARTSVRLTPGDRGGVGSSYLHAGAQPPAWVPAHRWNDRPLGVVAQVDLSELPATAAAEAALPRHGKLLVLSAPRGIPSGLSTDDAGAVAVMYVAEDAGSRARPRRQRTPPGAQPLRLTAELCLPRVWSSPVIDLDLTAPEQESWQALRRGLAARQGVTLFDEEDAIEPLTSMHRMFGYPDERVGHMRQACEAAARGIDLDHQPPYAHPRAAALEAGADRWRLLFQLTIDDSLGWSWGERRTRLYVWIDQDDLRAARFSRVWAIAQ